MKNVLLVVGALCATVLLLAFPQQAKAHAILLGSSPEANEQLDKSPDELVLNFNENIGPIFFRVLNTKGEDVGNPDDPRVLGNDMILKLNETLPNGTYLMTYRVVSADTHPVGASFLFSIGEPISSTTDMDMSGQQAKSGWWIPVSVNRFLLYTSVLFAIGSAVFLMLMNAPAVVMQSAASHGRMMAMIAGICYLASIGFGGSEMIMGGFGALFSANAWATGAGTTLGPSALLGVPGALLLFFVLQKGRGASPALMAVGSLLMLGSFLVTGHAATAPPVWLMATMVAIHIVCAGFWLAAFMPLAKATRLPEVKDAAAIMTDFSEKAVLSVAALFISGAVITWFQLLDLTALYNTDYGIRLALKIILFLALLGLAYYNKSVLTPALEKADAAAAEKMRGSIRKEVMLMMLILIAAVSLTLVTPPRALSDASASSSTGMDMNMGQEGFSETIERSGYTMTLDVTPAKTGENMAMMTFKDAAGNPIDLIKIESEWALPAAGLSGIKKTPERMAPGMYHLMFSDLIIPGDWEVRVGAFVTDFDKFNFRTVVPIK